MAGRTVGGRVGALLALLVVVALVAGAVLTAVALRRPLPDRSGSVDVSALQADVEVVRDGQGVPHVHAGTAEDLFLAQGYGHARDRFSETDLRRHVTAGRLGEPVGEVVETRDEVLRTALVEARLRLTRQVAEDPGRWSRGEVHTLVPRHTPLGGEPVPAPVRRLFDLRETPLAGGSRWVDPTGVSGHPLDPYHGNQLETWAAGETSPWAFTREAVEDVARERLVLRASG